MTSKVKLTISPQDYWANGGQSVAKIVTVAYQNGAQVAYAETAYGAWPLEAHFGADLPNGDTTFVSRAYSAADEAIGPENAPVFMNVDKTLVQIPGSMTAE